MSTAAGAGRWLPRPTVLGAIAAAWLLAIAAELSGRGAALHHGALIQSRLPVWAALPLFLLAWQAMMLPSSLPLIRLFGVIGAAQGADALRRAGRRRPAVARRHGARPPRLAAAALPTV